VGQAPGRKVHESGVPFADISGNRLRQWLGVTSEVFYIGKSMLRHIIFLSHIYQLPIQVQTWREQCPDFVPMPHPSPRNNLWFSRNPWFEAELLSLLRNRVKEVLEEKD
jgi:uracil-DNA glycosylase